MLSPLRSETPFPTGGGRQVSHLQADAVLLALGLGVGVVTSEYEAVAGEGGVQNARHDGVVHAGLPGDGVLQPVDGVVAFILHRQDRGE